MSSQPSIERLVADALQHAAPSSAPDGLVAEALASARSVRRRPRWLALLIERPMIRPPVVLVGSPGTRTAWLAIAAVLATVVGTVTLVAGGILPRGNTAAVAPSASVAPTPTVIPTVVVEPSLAPAIAPRRGLVAYEMKHESAIPCVMPLPDRCTITRVWLANTDGRDPHLLFLDEGESGNVLGWSADGSRLLYESRSRGLLIVDVTGTVIQALDPRVICPFAVKGAPLDRNACTGGDMPALSPDGRRIAFVQSYANADNATVIAVLDLSTSTVTELDATRTTNGSEQCWKSTTCQGMNDTPLWSPDGRRIVFARQVVSPEPGSTWTSGGIWTIGADGTGLQRLTPVGMAAHSPSWSPDGSSIAFIDARFVVNASGTSVTDILDDVYTVRADGSDLRRLTNDGRSYGPHWSVDGRRLTYARGDANWVMNLDGSGQARLDFDLATLTEAGCVACLYPASDGPNRAVWQPQGGQR